LKPTTRWAFAGVALIASGAALYLNGQLPAAMGETPWGYADQLAEALQAVDARGSVELAKLRLHRAALDSFIANLASTSTERFRSPAEENAFWLNAYHALTLQTLLDGDGWWQSWPVAGHRVTRWSIARHHLREVGDPRLPLARWDGSKSGPRLEAVPFDGVGLDRQLTEAVRRFIRRRDVVQRKGKVVELAPRLLEHERELLEALPEGNRRVLQFIWAFLPQTCDGEWPGCETRAALDAACGRELDACTVVKARE